MKWELKSKEVKRRSWLTLCSEACRYKLFQHLHFPKWVQVVTIPSTRLLRVSPDSFSKGLLSPLWDPLGAEALLSSPGHCWADIAPRHNTRKEGALPKTKLPDEKPRLQVPAAHHFSHRKAIEQKKREQAGLLLWVIFQSLSVVTEACTQERVNKGKAIWALMDGMAAKSNSQGPPHLAARVWRPAP